MPPAPIPIAAPLGVRLSAIGGEWKALILHHVTAARRRFDEPRRA